MSNDQLREIQARHPFPWREEILPHMGMVRLMDAVGNEVDLFLMTALCCMVTASIASRKEAA